MQSRIFQLKAFNLVGKKETLNMENDQHLQKIPEIWQLAGSKGGLIDLLLAINDSSIEGLLGVCDTSNTSDEHLFFDYWIGVNSSHTEDLTHMTVPAAKWIAFEVDGSSPAAIQQGFADIFENELAVHNVEAVLPYQIEYYSTHYIDNLNPTIEIWIPIEIM